MTSIVTYQKGLRSICLHVNSGNACTADASPVNHGSCEASSPADLTATSLAADCNGRKN
ncbi:MAG TPA: hypothetical protein VNJ07_05980 [Chitinophagales bacterium]|nr:hypothetical protein [Chitinophagales bacterium]